MSMVGQIMAGFARLAEAINAVNAKVGSGGAGAQRGGLAYVDFGTTPKRSTTLTVLCDWVSSDNSLITLKPNATGTLKNDSDEHLYGEFTLKPINIVDNVSFDILMESTSKYGCVGEFKINWSVIN